MGCPTCHTTDGSERVGPSLRALAGRTVALGDGSQVRRDRAYLRESIVDPTAKLVKGFTPGMASFRDRLGEREIADLVHYLESL
jgi:cytochrome c oxidase subunit 2